MAPHARELVLVYADWCPHCNPLSLDEAPKLARKLGVPLRLLDIDRPDSEAEADRLVERYGEYTPDYLIPQLFLRFDDGSVRHLLTGTAGSLEGTRRSWARLLGPA